MNLCRRGRNNKAIGKLTDEKSVNNTDVTTGFTISSLKKNNKKIKDK